MGGSIIKGKGYIVPVYSFTHFLVDFSCAFLLFSQIRGTDQWVLCALVYNFCAFALQMPIGLLADKLNRNSLFAALGCGLVAASYGLGNIPLLSAVIAGIGNGLFHVGGGVEVLNISKEKSAALGIFVSPGAFGIYFGTLAGKQLMLAPLLPILVLLASAAMILGFSYKTRGSFTSDNAPLSFEGLDSSLALLALGALFIVVCLRSYVGMILSFPWKSQWLWGVLMVSGVVFGKASGGLLADWLGSIKASVLSLGICAVLFVFSGFPPAGILAVFLFNMTMPVTLWAVARMMPGAKGFSFGLLTFGLFLGFVPAYLGLAPLFSGVIGLAAASLLSLLLLVAGLKKAVAG